MFLGFNALNTCESLIIQGLLQSELAHVYWDIDDAFLQENFFISKFITIKDKQHAIIIFGMIFASLYLINSFTRILLIYFVRKIFDTRSIPGPRRPHPLPAPSPPSLSLRCSAGASAGITALQRSVR